MLQGNNIRFSFGDVEILHGIDFQLKEKQIISLIGPNGSGKSTLLRCLSALLPVVRGCVFLENKDIVTYHKREIARHIAFLPQFQEDIKRTSVTELVSMGRAPYHNSGWFTTPEDREKIEWAMEFMQIADMRYRMVDSLSGGERQRAWIAMVLAQDTPIIFLDEPVTYMDLKHQYDLLEIVSILKESCGKTVVSVFHDINHALEVSDIIYALKGGQIVKKGGSDDVVTEELILSVFDIPAYVCPIKRCRKNVVVPNGCRRRKEKHDQFFSTHAG